MPEGDKFTVLDKNETDGLIGFHDITADDIGQTYEESVSSRSVSEDGTESQSSDLYLVELDGTAHKVAHDI